MMKASKQLYIVKQDFEPYFQVAEYSFDPNSEQYLGQVIVEFELPTPVADRLKAHVNQLVVEGRVNTPVTVAGEVMGQVSWEQPAATCE